MRLLAANLRLTVTGSCLNMVVVAGWNSVTEAVIVTNRLDLG
jgi:hypothetical protein